MADKLDLAAIKARCEAATPGPWEIYPDGKYFCVTPNVTASSFGGQTAKRDDAEFIAHAREDIPALVARVEQLQLQVKQQQSIIDAGFDQADAVLEAKLAEAKKALEFYAAARNYDKRDLSSAMPPISEIEKDWGTRARAVIENVLEKGGEK